MGPVHKLALLEIDTGEKDRHTGEEISHLLVIAEVNGRMLVFDPKNRKWLRNDPTK